MTFNSIFFRLCGGGARMEPPEKTSGQLFWSPLA